MTLIRKDGGSYVCRRCDCIIIFLTPADLYFLLYYPSMEREGEFKEF